MAHHGEISTRILSIIRSRSDAGQLVRTEEILTALQGEKFLESEDVEHRNHLKTTLNQLLQDNQDIREIFDRNGGCFYYSIRSMSETYAGILMWKSENPLRLIAEVVRDNSKLYPRPVPFACFLESPFDLTREDILKCLEIMGEEREYQDIAQTVTSVGTTFLYSSRHLDPDHAAMLAEWLDVGQADNP